jgi:hypothetical protein
MANLSIKSGTISRSMLVGNSPYIPPSYESISTVTVGAGGSSTVTFSSIPQTYKHLQIRYLTKDTYSVAADFVSFTITGNGTNTWRNHHIYGNGTDALSGTTANLIVYSTPNSHSSLANMFGVGIIDLLDYASTIKNKTFRVLNGLELNTNNTLGRITFQSLLKVDTAAISSLTFTADLSFAQNTQFSLYGIKG